jgi:hypothetical protein
MSHKISKLPKIIMENSRVVIFFLGVVAIILIAVIENNKASWITVIVVIIALASMFTDVWVQKQYAEMIKRENYRPWIRLKYDSPSSSNQYKSCTFKLLNDGKATASKVTVSLDGINEVKELLYMETVSFLIKKYEHRQETYKYLDEYNVVFTFEKTDFQTKLMPEAKFRIEYCDMGGYSYKYIYDMKQEEIENQQGKYRPRIDLASGRFV